MRRCAGHDIQFDHLPPSAGSWQHCGGCSTLTSLKHKCRHAECKGRVLLCESVSSLQRVVCGKLPAWQQQLDFRGAQAWSAACWLQAKRRGYAWAVEMSGPHCDAIHCRRANVMPQRAVLRTGVELRVSCECACSPCDAGTTAQTLRTHGQPRRGWCYPTTMARPLQQPWAALR